MHPLWSLLKSSSAPHSEVERSNFYILYTLNAFSNIYHTTDGNQLKRGGVGYGGGAIIHIGARFKIRNG